MKTLISTLAVALALAFTGPAFAGDVTAAKTQANCQKAGGAWDAATNTCAEKPTLAFATTEKGADFGRPRG